MKTKPATNYVGYARVSTGKQSLSLESQVAALEAAGCVRIHKDQISGAKSDRPGLSKCLSELKTGQTLVVVKIDRLGRSLSHLISVINNLNEKNVGFKSLQDGSIDTTTPTGKLFYSIVASMAEFERSLILDRTRAGLEAAKLKGRIGGRPPKDINDPVVMTARRMHSDGLSNQEICSTLKISGSTLHRYLNMGGDDDQK